MSVHAAQAGWPADVAARYRAAGLWTGQTFPQVLAHRARTHPGQLAVVGAGQRWTYAGWHARSERLAAGWSALGVVAGDRVLLQLPNVPEFLEVLLALMRLGAVPVLALPAHRESEIEDLARQSEAVAYVVPDRHGRYDYQPLARRTVQRVPGLRQVVVVPADGSGALAPGVAAELATDERFVTLPEVRDAAPRAGGELPPGPTGPDLALLQLSGGTTGTPKLIPRTHDDYLLSVRESADLCALTTDSVYLVALPVAHNFALSSPGALGALWAGARIVLAPTPDPTTTFALIESEQVTITGTVPPVARLWVEAAPATTRDLTSLQVVQVGGARCSDDLAARIHPALGADVQQVFGMAEGLVCYTRLDDPEDVRLHTQGRPVCAADEVRVVDEHDHDVPAGTTGHLLTRGPYTIRGYDRAPEHNRTAFTADGYYRTGDLVRQRPDGNLVVEGRAKDQINRGGEKIAVDEVEGHLLAHPGILDAALVAVPDELLGERTCAVVVPRARGDRPPSEPPDPLTPSQVRSFLRSRGLAAYKVPDLVRVVPAFPVTGIGKVSRRDLRAAVGAAVSTAVTTIVSSPDVRNPL